MGKVLFCNEVRNENPNFWYTFHCKSCREKANYLIFHLHYIMIKKGFIISPLLYSIIYPKEQFSSFLTDIAKLHTRYVKNK